jgi:hypothetical protein
MDDRTKSDDVAPALSAKEAEQMIIKNLPKIDHHGELVESVGRNSIRVRLPYNTEFMGAEPWQDGRRLGVLRPYGHGIRRYVDVLLRDGGYGCGRNTRDG